MTSLTTYAGSYATAPSTSKRSYLVRRNERGKMERTRWETFWRDVTDFVIPFGGRWSADDREIETSEFAGIIDNTAGLSLETLASGLMSGASSPAREWFRYTLPDSDLARWKPVADWLTEVGIRSRRTLLRSNCYRVLHQLYEECPAFGIGAAFMVEHPTRVLHLHPMTIGEYWVAQDSEERVNVLYRELRMSVGALVRQFGLEACSSRVRELFTGQKYDEPVDVLHAIEPRDESYVWRRNAAGRGTADMPYTSCYIELGAGEETGLLREGGFDYFPGLVPRWKTRPGDTYGIGPCMRMLGDIKSLQHLQLRKAQCIDYQTYPALQSPGAISGVEGQRLPGSMTPVDMAGPQAKIQPIWEPTVRVADLQLDIQDTRARIERGLYSDLFRMLASLSDTTQRTRAEIWERNEEKLVSLGPVYERLQTDLYEPLVEGVFRLLLERGELPPVPVELEGMDLNVEFVSTLAQAQKQVGAAALDRFVYTVAQLSAISQDAADRVDVDSAIDIYADALGVDTRALRSVEDSAEIRAARNKALAAKESAAMLESQARTAKDLAAAPVAGPQNALMQSMSQLQGYGAPAPLAGGLE